MKGKFHFFEFDGENYAIELNGNIIFKLNEFWDKIGRIYDHSTTLFDFEKRINLIFGDESSTIDCILSHAKRMESKSQWDILSDLNIEDNNIKGLNIFFDLDTDEYLKDTLEVNQDFLEIIKNILSKSAKEKPILVFSGTEPLKYIEKIKRILEALEESKLELEINIVTKGFLMTQAIFEYLKEKNIGVILQVTKISSIDDTVMKNYENYFKHLDKCTLSILDYKDDEEQNMGKELENIFPKIAVPKLDKSMTFLNTKTYKEMRELQKYTFGLCQGYLGLEADTLDFYKELLERFITKEKGCFCSIGKGTLAILPKGDIRPCWGVIKDEKFSMGNILDEELDVNQGLLKIENENFKEECLTCWGKDICFGGCIARNRLKEEDCNALRRAIEFSLGLSHRIGETKNGLTYVELGECGDKTVKIR